MHKNYATSSSITTVVAHPPPLPFAFDTNDPVYSSSCVSILLDDMIGKAVYTSYLRVLFQKAPQYALVKTFYEVESTVRLGLQQPDNGAFVIEEDVEATAPATDPVARGAYLVNVLGHCGECHTPRNFLGGPDKKALLAGAVIPEGKVPNLTPTRLQKWSDSDLKEYLTTGTAPNGDVVVEPMSEVITNTTSQLTPADLAAMVAYLRTVPPHAEPSKK